MVFSLNIYFKTPDKYPDKAQAVIALTGGQGERIAAAKILLDDGVAGKMLITGVNPGSTEAEIFALAGGKKYLFDCCVTIGKQARTTVGNGLETAAWLRENRLGTAVIVTSDYHMPRAYVELKSAAPEIEFQTYVVRSTRVDLHNKMLNPGTHFELLREYLKFLVAWSRWRWRELAELAG